MKYHTQTIKHDPANKKYGDCFRALLATLLCYDNIEEVPNFADLMYNEDGSENENSDWVALTQKYLAERNFQLVCIPFFGPLEGVLQFQKTINPTSMYILVGNSKSGCNHCVLAQGDQILHDPHPDKVGITGPCFDGYIWVEYLVPLSFDVVAETKKDASRYNFLSEPDNWTLIEWRIPNSGNFTKKSLDTILDVEMGK